MSNHHLFESNKSFVNQLSNVVIPNSVQDALTNPRWKASMNKEMKSLQKKKKKKHENLLIAHLQRSQLSVIGSIL